jgi:hypothetical protein
MIMPHPGHRQQEINGDKSFRGGKHSESGVGDGRFIEKVQEPSGTGRRSRGGIREQVDCSQFRNRESFSHNL